MLFKISLRNVRRSLKDYAIYFFTLVIGVSIFYVFNAISTQTAMLQLDDSSYEIVGLLKNSLSATSVFVAIILALLVVYASRFLMKRRHKEFAVYQTLGMSKGSISVMLLFETVIIGLASLVVGLLLGTALSQVMSAVVANLFEADMTSYKFMFSSESATKTILYFVLMYLAVVVFNNLSIGRMKLIDLIQSGRKTERITNRNVVLCVITFVAAMIALIYAYHCVGWDYNSLDEKKLVLCIALGSVSTFLIFWSVSGVALRLMRLMKKRFYHSINAFTFRQVSSVINTMVFSMTIICLMLFITICTIASAFSIRNSMNANIQELCPADVEIANGLSSESDIESVQDYKNIRAIYEDAGYDITEGMKDYVELNTYTDANLTIGKSLEPFLEQIQETNPYLDYDASETIVTLSEYNRLMELYGRKPLELNQGEYIMICNFANMKDLRDSVLAVGKDITVFGHVLSAKYTECQDGFIEISNSHINTGIYVVPDEVVSNQIPNNSYFIGNYAETSTDGRKQIEDQEYQIFHDVLDYESTQNDGYLMMKIDTKEAILSDAIGLGAVIAFLGLYIGFVFLISCGAILSLKCLSESVDGSERYTILRKIGVDERVISKSLLMQTGIFFFAPLALAIVHSFVGLRFAKFVLITFGTEQVMKSIGIASIILFVIYGGYFMITYANSKRIISD